jgi:uncharacterized cofD-like protein
MKKVITIGGGSGHTQVLKALKKMSEIEITGICPSTDSGGSTGILQKEYEGRGSIGDLTKCVVALCNNENLSKALLYRYENGPLHGHSVKNLLYHALEKVSSSTEALKEIWKICGLGPHRILPVTEEKTELCVRLSSDDVISGETNIDNISDNPLWDPKTHSISEVYLKPEVRASHQVLEALNGADFVIICPGDLYSSILPTLLPKGMKGSIQGSKAKIILIMNIMTKKGETDNYTADDFLEQIEKHLGRKADIIICNEAPIPENVLLEYSKEQKVELGSFAHSNDSRIVFAPLALITEEKIYSDPEIIKKTLTPILK